MMDVATEEQTAAGRQLTTRSAGTLPMIAAEHYQHLGRYAGAAVLATFEQIGGVSRMTTWADQNPTDFFTKLFPKLIARAQQVDISGSLTIDDAINRLDAANRVSRETPIDAQFDEIPQFDL